MTLLEEVEDYVDGFHKQITLMTILKNMDTINIL